MKLNKVLFGAAGVTSINPIILGILVLGILLILFLPRKHVIAPLIVLSMLIPLGQVLMLGSFHFQVFRILLFAGWIRLLFQRSKEGWAAKLKMNAIDMALIGYAVSCVVLYTLLWQQSAAFFNQIGVAYNTLGLYFFFRFFIRDEEDLQRAIKILAVVALVIGALMINEQMTGKNVLAIFGGVPENTQARKGYLRSQGPFQVYLTAGAFGASLLPLFLTMWRKGGRRMLATLGMAAAIAITVTSRTSTASSAAVGAAIGIGMWYFRDYMRLVRWGLVCTLTALHLVMKAPVWALIQRVDLVGGSDGWHRFKIVDNFINHFSDWWLLGARNYMRWEGGDDMWDLANQYVFTGESTGLLSLVFFLAAITYAFKYLGNARKAAGSDTRRAWFLWLLGVTLFANMVAFMGISYFDQTQVYWYLLLAIVVAATVPATERVPAEESQKRNALEELDVWSTLEPAPSTLSFYADH
jgi:hypothetical protein